VLESNSKSCDHFHLVHRIEVVVGIHQIEVVVGTHQMMVEVEVSTILVVVDIVVQIEQS
jgi:hypothetical protein